MFGKITPKISLSFNADLKQLFILLLRTCPLAPSFKIYLRDIITTNHVYLLMVEHVLSSSKSRLVLYVVHV